MRIDPHVHCRDGRQSYKETIDHVFRLCDEQGVDMIFDMPNTEPPVLTAADVEKRLALVPREARNRYRLYIGVTANEEQLANAVLTVRECESVVGLKLYAGKSVGDLAVVDECQQKQVYRILSAADYKGVLAVHCEKEALITSAFYPKEPHTHSLARPNEAEVASITDQIHFARSAGFRGTLHICHVSTAASLKIINGAQDDMNITCGVTPHHLLWSSAQSMGPAGLLYKVNPPLREPSDTVALRKALKDGNINWIETDHAPHPISEKLYPPYASGYPSLCLYRELVEQFLPLWGLNDDMIRNVTYANIVGVFNERNLLNDH